MNMYVLIQWPESQDYMEEEWFREEAVLDNSENAGMSSYFIPFERIEHKENYYRSIGLNPEEIDEKIHEFKIGTLSECIAEIENIILS